MKCKHCESEIELQSAIDSAEFSWPLRQTVWCLCSRCGNGNHVRFERGIAQVVSLSGSPGYEYEVLSSTNEPTIEVRADQEYLHVWLQGKHHEVQARA
ncbi:hypothetical protein ACG1BZ_20725 [Microbulbifer sp. CNSA002]|uniref:hypothetical protein n=1 Tax=Microbulbifer sp. CNSA002 TaxID=3373604 RepID=UPI0039B4E50D